MFYIIQAIQNLSEETWSRADENLIELCFVAFLSNKSKKCFILVSRQQKLSRYRVCIAFYGRTGNTRSNLNALKFEVNFCEIKAEHFQATFLILLALLE